MAVCLTLACDQYNAEVGIEPAVIPLDKISSNDEAT